MTDTTGTRTKAGGGTAARPTAQRWTAARRRSLAEFVEVLQRRLRLQDWTIVISEVVSEDNPGESTLASITPDPRKRRAVLQCGATFLDLTAPAQTQVLVHEMVHVHLAAYGELVTSYLALLSAGVRKAAEIAVLQQEEFATDGLADALLAVVPVFDIDAHPTTASTESAEQGTGRTPRVPAAATRPKLQLVPATAATVSRIRPASPPAPRLVQTKLFGLTVDVPQPAPAVAAAPARAGYPAGAGSLAERTPSAAVKKAKTPRVQAETPGRRPPRVR
jgi:hypothetical protein